LIAVFLSGFQSIRGGDLLWHLPAGRLLLDGGSFQPTDTFSHTMRGEPIAPHAPAFQILTTFLFQTGGWPALAFLQALLTALLFALTARFARRFGPVGTREQWLLVPLFWLGIPQFGLHPQLFSFVFLLALLCLAPPPGQLHQPLRILASAAVAALWPFFHPSFPIGIGVLVLHTVLNRCRWSAGAALAVTLLVAVTQPGLLANVWVHSRSPVMMEHVAYWRPTWRMLGESPAEIWVKAHLLFLSGAFVLTAMLRRFPLGDIWFPTLTGAAALWAGWDALRFYPLIPLVVGAFLVGRWGNRLDLRWIPLYVALSAASVLLIPLFSIGVSLNTKQLPVACVAYLKTHRLPGRIFNSYTFGGYLIYATEGTYPVFIDPRSSQLYPDEFLRSVLDAYRDPLQFEELAARHRVGHTLLKADSAMTRALIDHLDRSPEWETIYRDPICAIHRKVGFHP
jgi:hypothetical protein